MIRLPPTIDCQSLEQFVEDNNFVRGLNTITKGELTYEVYINERGNLDSIYEGCRYRPAIRKRHASIEYGEDFYLFDGKVVEGHPYYIKQVCKDRILAQLLPDGGIKHITLLGVTCESFEFIADKDGMIVHKEKTNIKSLDEILVMEPIVLVD